MNFNNICKNGLKNNPYTCCNPIKSLFEVENFLQNVCRIKKSICFAKATKKIINNNPSNPRL